MTENNSNGSTKNTGEMRVALLQAKWFSEIVGEARKTFISTMDDLSDGKAVVDLYDIPGALEAPLLAKKLAKTGKYDVIAVVAFVTDGGVYRHEFVADAVISGMMQVQLETEVPVISASLTPHNYHNAPEQFDFFFGHFAKKGAEAAEACYMTVENLRNI